MYKVKVAVPLTAVVITITYRRKFVKFFHLTAGGLVQDNFRRGVLPGGVESVLLADRIWHRRRAADAHQQPAAIHRTAYSIGLARQVLQGHFTGGAVQPGKAFDPKVWAVFLVKGSVIVPGWGKRAIHLLLFHATGGRVNGIAQAGPLALSRVFLQVQVYRIIPDGHTVVAAIQRDACHLFLRGCLDVRFDDTVDILICSFVEKLMKAIQTCGGFHLGTAWPHPACDARLVDFRRGAFPVLGGRFGGHLRGSGGRRLGGLRPAGGEGQGQGQQAGNGFFHRVFSFRVCIYLPVYISIGV